MLFSGNSWFRREFCFRRELREGPIAGAGLSFLALGAGIY